MTPTAIIREDIFFKKTGMSLPLFVVPTGQDHGVASLCTCNNHMTKRAGGDQAPMEANPFVLNSYF
jgi:hypothetical protein